MKIRAYMAAALLLVLASLSHSQVRVKDVARLVGMGGVRLIGYGLVVGLDRSGDSPRSLFTNQSLVNMLERFGLAVDAERVRARNVAGVMVTADVPAYSRAGGRFDVTVSSLGDATSLQGGVLLQTVLTDIYGQVWGVATGPITTGGFSVELGLVSVRQAHPLVGRIPDGGTLDRDLEVGVADSTRLTYMLREGDFTNARRLADAVNSHFEAELAAPIDAVSVEVAIPEEYRSTERRVVFISELESLSFEPDIAARVVINERTGTIVIGDRVSLRTVAISHGMLSITIKGVPLVSQPPPFAPGETVVVPYQEVTVEQRGIGVVTIPGTATVGDVASALSRLGVTPLDIIAIFQALKQAGALQAELIII